MFERVRRFLGLRKKAVDVEYDTSPKDAAPVVPAAPPVMPYPPAAPLDEPAEQDTPERS